MSTPEEPFPRLLRRHRLAAMLSQEALAERAGLSCAAVGQLERGRRTAPRLETVRLLAEALGLRGEERVAFEAAALRQATPTTAPSTIDGTAPAATPPTAEPVPLVGRGSELALLARHLEGEGPPVLLLAGEPGIGKSRLLQATAQRASEVGWRVLAAGCARRGGQAPYSPLLEALEHALQGQSAVQTRAALLGCAWLVRLLPELAAGPIEPLPPWTLSPEQERRLVFKAVGRLLANLAGPAGTLLVLDDLQWAGVDALELLALLVRAQPASLLRVVGAYRDTEVGPDHPLSGLLSELAEAQRATRHALRPLAQHEAEELFSHLRGGRGQHLTVLAAQVVRRAGGVPFFLVSYARGLVGELETEPAVPEVPWDLRESIRRRVTAVSEEARAALAVAAVIGRVSPRSLLLAVLERPEREVLTGLEGACRAGLLEEIGEDGYGFVHDVIHEVVEGELGLARRRLLHRQVAVALETQDGKAPVEALAYHFRQAGSPARAAVYLERAGDLASARYAHAVAADHYQDLAACLEELGRTADLLRVREKLSGALYGMADFDAALGALEPVADARRAAGDLDGWWQVEAMVAALHGIRGTITVGLARLQPIVESLEAAEPSCSLANLLMSMRTLLERDGQLKASLAMAERAMAIAKAMREVGSLARVELAQSLLLLNRADDALQALEDAVQLAAAEEDSASLRCALSLLAWAHEERGEYELDRQHAERALGLAQRVGDLEFTLFNLIRLGLSAFFFGDWLQAGVHLEEAVAVMDQIGLTAGMWYKVSRLALGLLRMAQGDWDEACRYLKESLESGTPTLQRVAEGQLAEWEVLTGNPQAACARLTPLLDRPGVEERMVTQYVLPVLAWGQLEAGELDQAAAMVTEAVRRGRTGLCRFGLVAALRVQALLALREGDAGQAEQALEEGLQVAQALPYPYGEGRLMEVYGRLHLDRGEPTAARERLEAALTVFRRLGARKDLERVEALVATLG